MPNINEILFKVEGFKYAESFHINIWFNIISDLVKMKVTYVQLFFHG